jgi:hypothetical protein
VFAANPAPFTDTVRFAGVAALVGATLSHVEPELALAVKLAAPLALLTAIVCEAGADPPSPCENDNDVGAVVIAGVGLDIVNVTGTEVVVVPAVIVMEL